MGVIKQISLRGSESDEYTLYDIAAKASNVSYIPPSNPGETPEESTVDEEITKIKTTPATTSKLGMVKPDGTTIKINNNGVISGTSVDSSLSTTSINPVQNKIVTAAINGKANTNHTHTVAQVSGAIPSSEKGAANGVANLNSSAKIPNSLLSGKTIKVLEIPSISSSSSGASRSDIENQIQNTSDLIKTNLMEKQYGFYRQKANILQYEPPSGLAQNKMIRTDNVQFQPEHYNLPSTNSEDLIGSFINNSKLRNAMQEDKNAYGAPIMFKSEIMDGEYIELQSSSGNIQVPTFYFAFQLPFLNDNQEPQQIYDYDNLFGGHVLCCDTYGGDTRYYFRSVYVRYDQLEYDSLNRYEIPTGESYLYYMDIE